ncbi:hypothetical protein BH09MYX1_BH09MYX1_45190 [soil metagenome]
MADDLLEELVYARDWNAAGERLSADAKMVSVAIVSDAAFTVPSDDTKQALASVLAFVRGALARAEVEGIAQVFAELHENEARLETLTRATPITRYDRALQASPNLVSALSVGVAEVLALRFLHSGDRASAERASALTSALRARLTAVCVMRRIDALVGEHGAERAREICLQVAALLPEPDRDPLAIDLRRLATRL